MRVSSFSRSFLRDRANTRSEMRAQKQNGYVRAGTPAVATAEIELSMTLHHLDKGIGAAVYHGVASRDQTTTVPSGSLAHSEETRMGHHGPSVEPMRPRP